MEVGNTSNSYSHSDVSNQIDHANDMLSFLEGIGLAMLGVMVNGSPAQCDCSGTAEGRREEDGGDQECIDRGAPCAEDIDCYIPESNCEPLVCYQAVCLPPCDFLPEPISIPCGPEDIGECHPGTQLVWCEEGEIGMGECEGAVDPSPEIWTDFANSCDGLDNDCDGIIDNFSESRQDDCEPGWKETRMCQNGVWSDWSECLRATCKEGDLPDVIDCDTGLPGECGPGYMVGFCNSDGYYEYGECISRAATEEEICDNIDNDCDGMVDDGLGQTTCGLGVCEHTVNNCINGALQTCNRFGGASNETCDGLDNNCNGLTDEDLTRACSNDCGGGLETCIAGVWADCTAPGAGDEVCDYEDNDCDGRIDEGFDAGMACHTGVGGCFREGVFVCSEDGLSVFCNAVPGNPRDEVCDGIDNDCDELTDEHLGQTTCGLGVCEHTVDNCINGAIQTCDPFKGASNEVCDDLDNNCNGLADEYLVLRCYSGSPDTRRVGECLDGTKTCLEGEWGDCIGEHLPVTESCDNRDNDCDGTIDGIMRGCYSGPPWTAGVGICRPGIEICERGAWSVQCIGEVLPAREICNRLDDDCDREIDDGMDNPINLSLISESLAGGIYTFVDVQDRHVYVSTVRGMDIIDVSDPFNPGRVASFATPGWGMASAVQDDKAYIADWEGGLRVVDIADPQNPREIAYLDTPGFYIDVDVDGPYAYVLGRDVGLDVIDISDPYNPTRLGNLRGGISYQGRLLADGSYVYVTGFGNPNYVIDVSDPTDPHRVSGLGGWRWGPLSDGLDKKDNWVFISYFDLGSHSNKRGLIVADVTDPESPIVSNYDLPIPDGMCTDIDVDENGFGYLTCRYGGGPKIVAVDLRNPHEPTVIGSTPSYFTPLQYRDFNTTSFGGPFSKIKDGYLYAPGGTSGLNVFDISNPYNVSLIGQYKQPGPVVDVEVNGELAVVGGSPSVRLLNISDMSSPAEKGSMEFPPYSAGVRMLDEQNAVIAAHRDGLRVVDVSEEESPLEVGFSDTPSHALDLRVKGDNVYVADDTGGLFVFDVFDRENPRELSSLSPTGRWLISLALHGNKVFLANYMDDVPVIDIADPSAPFVIAQMDFPYYSPTYVTVDSDYYYGDTRKNFVIYDISNLSSPRLVSSTPIEYRTTNVFPEPEGPTVLGEHYAFVGHMPGVKVYSICDKRNPVLVGEYDAPGIVSDMRVVGDYVFVADMFSLIILRKEVGHE